MKRIARIIPLLVLLVSCRNEQEDPAVPVAPVSPEAESEVFYGTTENGPDSKAFADADLKVLWNADDRVSIFAKDNYNRQYRFTGEDGANAGAFERVDTGDASEAQALTCNYAVYPYSPATAVSSDGVLTVSLPAEQAYKENSFGAGAVLDGLPATRSAADLTGLCAGSTFELVLTSRRPIGIPPRLS